MKVFLIAGQSNAVGTSPTDGLEGYVFPDVLLWQAGEFTEENEKLQNVWLRGVRPGMGYTPRHSGIELGICAGLKKGMPRAFVRYAYGTTDLVRDWRSESLWRALPGKRGDAGWEYLCWKNAFLRAQEAAGEPLEAEGLFFMQGESDAYNREGAARYAENLAALLSDMRAFLGRADLPVCIGEIATKVSAYAPYAEQVRAGQRACCARDKNAAWVPSADLPMSDGWHYTARGAVALGERFAAAMARLTEEWR